MKKLKKLGCMVLVLALSALAAGCGGTANHAGMEALAMPQEADFAFGTSKYSENASVGGHDPCMIRDEASGMYYFYSTDNSVDSSKPGKGIQIRRSENLVDFEYVGVALSKDAIKEAQDNGKLAAKTKTFWAPCIRYTGGEYRLYYASTKGFGSSESRIWLATSASPEGPFENRGVVVSSWIESGAPTGPNAIDPELIETPEGKTYLVYGSFFGGIYLKELAADGLAANADRASEDYFGTRLAQKGGSSIDGPEGASILYSADAGYYYLFLSYGWLGDTYDVRVGRSKEVTGPYLDYNGHEMDENTKGLTTGTKLAASYRFQAAKPGGEQPYVSGDWAWGGFRGPGHGSVYQDGDASYFVHHIRDGASSTRSTADGRASYTMHYLMVREMYFVDGWPVLSPERYAGESAQTIPAAALAGDWEGIHFTNADNSQEMSFPITLGALGLTGSGTAEVNGGKGSWRYDQDAALLSVTLPDGAILDARVAACWDLENSRAALCFTGLDTAGAAWWGKSVPGAAGDA